MKAQSWYSQTGEDRITPTMNAIFSAQEERVEDAGDDELAAVRAVAAR